jgi:hypothetical protein
VRTLLACLETGRVGSAKPFLPCDGGRGRGARGTANVGAACGFVDQPVPTDGVPVALAAGVVLDPVVEEPDDPLGAEPDDGVELDVGVEAPAPAVVVGDVMVLPLPTLTLLAIVALPEAVLEMWMLVMGALTFVFWSCMPMSPKPRVLIWVGLPPAVVDAGVTGVVAAATVVGQLAAVGVTSLTRSMVRVLVVAGRSAKVIATRRTAAAARVSMAGRIQRFSMYMTSPSAWCSASRNDSPTCSRRTG